MSDKDKKAKSLMQSLGRLWKMWENIEILNL